MRLQTRIKIAYGVAISMAADFAVGLYFFLTTGNQLLLFNTVLAVILVALALYRARQST